MFERLHLYEEKLHQANSENDKLMLELSRMKDENKDLEEQWQEQKSEMEKLE